MKIIEVRDGFIKIESEEKQDLVSFLEIKDVENKYIAQIVKINKIIDLKPFINLNSNYINSIFIGMGKVESILSKK